MKRKIIFPLVAVLIILFGVCWWRSAPHDSSPQLRDEHSSPSSVKRSPSKTAPVAGQTAISQPRLFKSTRYPPETPEEKAMWEWWRSMNKADPSFQWKMPIEFYGKVVDQFSEPVAAATVDITWTAVDDSHRTEILSDADGNFQFTGVRGKSLGVSIRKVGYLPTKQSGGGFEYAEFSNERFHVANREHPVVFRLQKLMGAEPMLKFITNAEVDVGANSVVLNAETGKLGRDGDVSFSIITGSKGPYGPDFTITITAKDGAAFAFSEDEFMNSAPAGGYQAAAVFNKLSSGQGYNRVQPYRFYVKTRSGKYAAVDGDITIREGLSEGKAGFHAIVYHNPSGSRNLEFDHRKWLNR